MKEILFTGSGVAIVTPFHAGAVNFPAFGRLIDRQIDGGTDAIIVCGTTGEAATMTQKERMETIAYCVDRVAGRVPVIAGTGANDTQVARENALAAERLGVDGLLIVTPYYNKATQQGLLRHYKVIADSVGIPIILYNVPSRTGVNIQPETYAELAQHPNIAGVKEASGNFSQIQKTRNLCPADFSIWSGNDDETAAICMLGGSGVISVAANVLPAEMHRLTALCLANDFSAAGRLQLKLKPLCDALFCEVNPIPVKTALNLMGLEAGELRLPLCPPTDASVERLKLALSSWDLLPEQTPCASFPGKSAAVLANSGTESANKKVDFRSGKEGCARETQEGIHRRLKSNSESCVSAVWEPSSKQARLIRPRRRFARFPAPLKSIFSELCKSSENGLSGEKRFFRHAECRCPCEQRHFGKNLQLFRQHQAV